MADKETDFLSGVPGRAPRPSDVAYAQKLTGQLIVVMKTFRRDDDAKTTDALVQLLETWIAGLGNRLDGGDRDTKPK